MVLKSSKYGSVFHVMAQIGNILLMPGSLLLVKQINYTFFISYNYDQETEIQSIREDIKSRIYRKLPEKTCSDFFHEKPKLVSVNKLFFTLSSVLADGAQMSSSDFRWGPNNSKLCSHKVTHSKSFLLSFKNFNWISHFLFFHAFVTLMDFKSNQTSLIQTTESG